MVVCGCNPRHSGGWGRRMAWTQEVEAAVSYDHATVLLLGLHSETPSLKKIKLNKQMNKTLAPTTACLPRSWLVSDLIHYRFGYLGLLCSYWGMDYSTDSMHKETKAQRGWVIEGKVSVGLEPSASFSWSTLPLQEAQESIQLLTQILKFPSLIRFMQKNIPFCRERLSAGEPLVQL